MNGAAAAACDGHAHVFGPRARYPLDDAHRYVPGEAGVDALRAHLAKVGATRVVLVQPSVYGHRHDCLLAALQALGGAARGVACASLPEDPMLIDACRRAGVTALRVIVAPASGAAVPLERALARARELGWHVELQVEPDTLSALMPAVDAAQVPVVLEHCGLLADAAHPGLGEIEARLGHGRLWVKLSGLDRLSRRGVGVGAQRELLRRLVAVSGSHTLWASDWPHTPFHARSGAVVTAPFRTVDDLAHLHEVAAAAARHDARDDVLWNNAARLYGFAAARTD